MPYIWTHMLFCENIVDAISSEHPFSQYEPCMKLGAQGPDPFFYYNFWPWIKNESVNSIGTTLHTLHCGEFVMDLIESAKEMGEPIQAYVFGFITHYILDRNTHPYIHYFAGYKGNDHQRLEVIIDTLMMKKYHNLKTWKVPVYKEINVGFSLDSEIVNLLHKQINKHYPEIDQTSTKYIQKSYRDMRLALKILSDPHGWKNFFFKPLISAYSHQPIKNDIDYLNLKETTWYHSATNKPSTKSFIHLYDEAKLECIEIMNEVLNYWHDQNEHSKQILFDLIGNISFDTGLPLSLNLKNKYSKSIV